jgi:hypothetical protein
VARALLDKKPMQEISAHRTMLEPSQTTTSGREPTSNLLSVMLVICQTPAWLGKKIGAIEPRGPVLSLPDSPPTYR